VVQRDNEGLDGGRVTRDSELTGLRSDATESIAVRFDVIESSIPLKSASLKYPNEISCGKSTQNENALVQ